MSVLNNQSAPDVICMGELLIDFVPTQAGVRLADAPAFKKAAGGAPANVAVGLSRLGVQAGFMGKVGNDDFGHYLAEVLNDNGVDTTGLCFSDIARTALAFVSLTAQGERDFMFYRHPSADMLFEPDEVNASLISQANLFHYGSISLISEPGKSATLHALKLAKQDNLLISYDPNLRLPLWPNEAEARKGLRLGWQHAHLIKASAEEITFLSGQSNVADGVAHLWHDKLKLVLVTAGAEGSFYFTPKYQGQIDGYSVTAVDTTGAGDGFVAGFLSQIIKQPGLWKDESRLQAALRFANAVGAITTTQLGAIPALPQLKEVESFLNKI